MGAGSTSTSTLAQILKIKYPQKKLAELNFADAALLAMLSRDPNLGGKQTNIAVNYGRSQGSHDFATAQTNATADDDIAFAITRAKDYHVCTMTAEAILAAKGDQNTIVNGLTRAMDNGKLSFKRSVSFQLYRNGGGARGRVSAGSTVASATISLAEPKDAVFFEVNMYLAASATDGTSGTVRTGKEKLLKISRGATTANLTSTSATWATVITALAVNDYLFRDGDFGLSAKGLDAWLPTTAPTGGDSFFGVDRSADAERLAGLRWAATAGSAEEDTLVDAASYLGEHSGNPDVCFVHNTRYRNIVKNLGAKVTYDTVKSADGKFGFTALKLLTDRGELKVVPDPNCQKDAFYMLDLKTWKLGSMGEVPHFADDDTNKMLRQSAADGVEWRLRAFWQEYCDAPGSNLRGTF